MSRKRQEQSAPRAAQEGKAIRQDQPAFRAEAKAIVREAIKDVRSTIHEIFFGQRESFGEPGTPLNPTPQMVTNDLGTLGSFNQKLDVFASRSQPSRAEPGCGLDR